MYILNVLYEKYSPRIFSSKIKKGIQARKKTWEFFKNVDLSQEIFQGKNFKVTDGQQNYNRSA